MGTLLQMSIAGAVLIAVIAVVRALTGNWLPKKTFVVLWSIAIIRLLAPFAIPTKFSFYSLLEAFTKTKEQGIVSTEPIPQIIPRFGMSVADHGMGMGEAAEPFSNGWMILWLAGLVILAVYYLMSYIRWKKKFNMSIPAANSYVLSWQEQHKGGRGIQVRVSEYISAPLAYGVLHPVILLPKEIDWADETALSYVLAHEYIHILRFDTVLKILIAIALCVHWLNPLVWLMYFLANRDIELSCDEKVIQIFGESKKSAYAMTLIGMEEKQSGFPSFCNNFSKTAIEKRVKLIMKMRKPTVLTLLIMILLIGSVTTIFATSFIPNKIGSAGPDFYMNQNTSLNESAQPSAASGKGDGIIVYDTAEVRHYTDGGAPYVYWQRTNNTEQSVTNIQFSMLAYDKNGNALKLPWNVTDSSTGSSYDVLCEWKPQNLKSKQQADSANGFEEGGWSLGWTINMFEKDTPELTGLFSQVAYILCCDKQITFEDESIWENPNYNDWLETYKGKTTDVAILKNYYPNSCKIGW